MARSRFYNLTPTLTGCLIGSIMLPSAYGGALLAEDVAPSHPVSETQTLIGLAENRQYFFRSNRKTLREMLRYYSRLTGIQYFYSEPRIGFIEVGRIEGQLALGEALRRTLRNTGYDYQFTDANTVVIYEPEPAQPDNGMSGEDLVPAIPETMPGQQFYEVHVSAPRTTALGFKKISPTVVLDGGELQRRGVINVAKALYEAPFINASVSEENSTYTEFGAGANMLDLRNLGVTRTLVLVNGRRHVPSNGGSTNLLAVDMNMLPVGLIERVEVLTTGASVLYGADALGGLVNVKLKDDYEGLELTTQGNLAQEGDNRRFNIGLSLGGVFGEGVFRYKLFGNYNKYNGLRADDRFITSDPAGHAMNGQPGVPEDGAVLTRGFGRSSTSASGAVWGYETADGNIRAFDGFFRIALGEDGQPLGEFTGTPDQLYNFAADSDLSVPIETKLLSGSFNIAMGDNHELFFEGTLAGSSVERELAPTPLVGSAGQGIIVPIDNPFIPEQLSEEVIAELGPDVAGLFVARRVVELGNRTNEIRRDLYRVAVGFQGTVFGSVDYSLYYQYGNSVNQTLGFNTIDSLRLAASLSPELCAQDSQCTLANIFGSNTITAAQANYLRAHYLNRTSNDQKVLAFEARSDVANLPAGPMSLIAGLQYRRETSQATPDPLVQQGRIASLSVSLPSRGSFDVKEAYAAITAPIFNDSKLGQELTFDAGLRYSHFSSSKGAMSWQVGLFYQPTSSISFRASYQEANRAPNVAELFFPATFSRAYYVDPCNNVEQLDTNSIIYQNCTADNLLGGIPDGFVQEASLVDGRYSGNATLTEEHANTQNIGFTYKPILEPKYGDLRLSVDWFSITIKDVIQGQLFYSVITDCYNSENFSSIYCGTNPANGMPFFVRDPATHEIGDVNISNWNDGTYNVKGFDAEFAYTQTMENLGLPSGWGSFLFRVLYSYNLKSDLLAEFSGSEEFRGNISQPVHRLTASFVYENGPLNLNWTSTLRGAGRVNLRLGNTVDGNHAPLQSYHHVTVNYELAEGLSAQLGVENLFNSQPPFLAYNTSNTFPEYYDVVGRRFLFGAKYRF